IWLGTVYALGHAAVVFLLGVVAILAGRLIPEGFDVAMGKIVGVTLVVLGVYVFVSLIRHGRDFRLRSRWMLVFDGAKRAARWVRSHVAGGRGTDGASTEHDQPTPGPADWHHGHHGRPGHHHHDEPAPDDHGPSTYGTRTALGIGVIHGIGAETPSQVLLFLAAAQAANRFVGLLALLAFVAGLLVSNSLITVGSAIGFLHASRNFVVYATVAVVAGVFSLVLGVLFLFGLESVLPAFFGG
ncbi:MAG TPA: hypothetical protein VEA19_07755, partial [Actinomycetota bacterium]|nr:hypothetical protein [Actinomycetota bacterium]